MRFLNYLLIPGLLLIFAACNRSEEKKVFLGADLSYLNEMEDCDGEFRENGLTVDPYELFANKGCNLVRVRLWNNPTWSGYSDYKDVELTIQRSKAQGMEVLLDFHYSDTWADPQHQVIPQAWENINELSVLGDSLYNFTFNTLMKLVDKNLLPEMVQVGNEVNIEIMQPEDSMNVNSINWERNIYLLHRGIKAVEDAAQKAGKEIQIMMHIAQPENALWWFAEAEKNGLTGYDWIGLSYYPKWSSYKFDELPQAIDSLHRTFNKRVMIVETAYPFTFENADEAGNILGEDALIPWLPCHSRRAAQIYDRPRETHLAGRW